ncbi:MAG: T9SS type A sorting domain-containing protein [Bacteroidia bacterium]
MDSIINPYKGARATFPFELNGNYHISGFNSFNVGNSMGYRDAFVLKSNNYGDSIISKTDFNNHNKDLRCQEIYNIKSNLYIFGSYYDSIVEYSNLFLTILDTNYIEISRKYIVFDTITSGVDSGVVLNFIPSRVKLLKDSTFLILGRCYNPGNYHKPMYFKLDTLGNIIWNKKIEEPISGQFHAAFGDAVELPDNSIVFSGYKNFEYCNFHNSDIWIAKADKFGNLLWDVNWYSPPQLSNYESALSIAYDEIENSLAISTVRNQIPYLFKIDTSGAFYYNFDNPTYEDNSTILGSFSSIINTHDGNFLAIGYRKKQSNNNNSEAFIVKYNNYGSFLWKRKFIGFNNGHVNFTNGIATSDGGFLLTGSADTPIYTLNFRKVSAYVVKTNCLGFTGPPQAQMQCSGTGLNYTFTNLSERADSCYLDFGDGSPVLVIRAEHDTFPINHTYAAQGNYQITLIATACGEADTMVCSFNTSTGALYDAEDAISVFPNPASQHLTIKSSSILKNISIYNAFGALVYKEKVENTNTKIINVETLKSGVYFIEVEDDLRSKIEKVIKN